MDTNYTETLADFATQADFDSLTDEAIRSTKRLVLDTLGCIIGGYSTEMGKISVGLANRLGGNSQSTILVTGDRTSATNAAFAHGEMANALDTDQVLMHFGHHGSCVVAAALAMAEMCQASGKDLVSAVAIGYELAGRFGLSLRRYDVTPQGTLDHRPTAGLGWGVLGAAAAASKILGLDRDKMLSALGIAGFIAPVPTSGRFQSQRAPRPMTKYIVNGALAEGGIKAALLSEAGFTGDRTILDGERGFWKMIGGAGCNWDSLTSGLGESWLITKDSYKPYPGGRHTNAPLHLFRKILRENSLTSEEIDRVEVGVNPTAVRIGWGENTVISEVDGQFSIPYLFGVAALGIEPGPRWHAADMRANPLVHRLAQKVEVIPEPEAPAVIEEQLKAEGIYKRCPVSVKVTARRKTFTARADYSKGDPWTAESKMSDDEMKEKFVNFSSEFLPPAKIRNAIEIIYDLEKESSPQRLISCLTR